MNKSPETKVHPQSSCSLRIVAADRNEEPSYAMKILLLNPDNGITGKFGGLC